MNDYDETTMSAVDLDVDETARYILLEQSKRSFGAFHDELHDQHPHLSLLSIADLWGRYMGWDGRSTPTHDLNTGKRRSNK